MPKFQENNTASVKHGGAAARRAISTGEEFTGLASVAEKQIQADYEQNGAKELLKKDALRIQTAAELYWSAVIGAAVKGDFERFESYVKTFGWLATAGARLLGQVIAIEGKEHPIDASVVLDQYREGNQNAQDN